MNTVNLESRSKPRRWPWVLGIAGFGVFVVVQLALATVKLAQAGSVVISLSLVAVLVVAVSVVLALWLGVQNQSVRLAVLRRRNPHSVVLPMIHPEKLTDTLRWLGYRGPRIGNYFVAVASERGIEFWKGGREPELRYTLPRELIVDVQVGEGIVTRPIDVINVVVPDEKWGHVIVKMSPSKEGWRLPFSRLDRDDIGELAHRIAREVLADEARR
ncbi:hypothetical protein [Microbacterium thalassium]|uniref:Uncharacterized protein n=1 Tax=Microbacterium thalassium TaxID=362649 RepID=A0A7X0FTL8_9MICO|nr:hypothetical protein [Microbacterium thalassium]MBB6392965.1 hypothetical protein [Microbacterium thalassium]